MFKQMRQVLGYILGFTIFIVGIPALMWLVAGRPAIADLPVGRIYLAVLVGLIGLFLSIWTIRNGPGGFSKSFVTALRCKRRPL